MGETLFVAQLVDSDGFYIDTILIDKDGAPVIKIPLDSRILANSISPCLKIYADTDGIIKPKWDGNCWIESATEEEIIRWNNEHPFPDRFKTSSPNLAQRVDDLERGQENIWNELASAYNLGVNEA